MSRVIKQKTKVENMIFEVRGKQVMLDSDLAKLYQCKNGTKDINKAVGRHLNRFPERFRFQLTRGEFLSLKFQIGTSNGNGHGGVRKLPYVFTEQGVAMLSAVLRTEVAEEASVKIMDAFVSMRKYIGSNLLEQKYINNQVMKNTEDIKLLQDSFAKFEEKRKTSEIYFNGQIYDAYSKIYEIFAEAKENLIIVDNYADKTILDIIRKLKIKTRIITKRNNSLTKQDLEKYKKQYSNLKVIYDDTFHDRYFILDNKMVYHCGASINRIGYKTFSITKIEDEYLIKSLITKLITDLNLSPGNASGYVPRTRYQYSSKPLSFAKPANYP